MPRATADTTKTERYDLKSLPGGFVVLRQLSYGQMLARQELAAELAVKTPQGGNRQQAVEGLMRIMQTAVSDYEFKNCIVEHNLEDENGNLLNFQVKGTVARLDPKVGAEVNALIDSLNQFEEFQVGDLGNSDNGSETSS